MMAQVGKSDNGERARGFATLLRAGQELENERFASSAILYNEAAPLLGSRRERRRAYRKAAKATELAVKATLSSVEKERDVDGEVALKTRLVGHYERLYEAYEKAGYWKRREKLKRKIPAALCDLAETRIAKEKLDRVDVKQIGEVLMKALELTQLLTDRVLKAELWDRIVIANSLLDKVTVHPRKWFTEPGGLREA